MNIGLKLANRQIFKKEALDEGAISLYLPSMADPDCIQNLESLLTPYDDKGGERC